MKYALVIFLFISSYLYAAVNIERTKVVFNEGAKVVGVGVINNDKENPYLVQSWIEDANFIKLPLNAHLAVIPPVKRMEGNEKTILQVISSSKSSQLPTDRETLFYLNIREIPKQKKDANIMQVAIQTTIKLIYRPKNIKLNHDEYPAKNIKLHLTKNGIVAENPSPYFISIVGFSKQKDDKEQSGFQSITLKPFSSDIISDKKIFVGSAWLTTVTDSGGRLQFKVKVS